MKKMIVFFRTSDDIVILYNNVDEYQVLYDGETILNVTEYVSEWASNRDLDINNLSQEDLEHLKAELILFKGVYNVN